MNQQNLSALIWSVADLLRGDYKQSDYGKVILPFTVLRQLDCVLAPTKAAVLAEHDARLSLGIHAYPFLLRKSGQSFYNTSPLAVKKLQGDQIHIRNNLYIYIEGFSDAVHDIFEPFNFHAQVDRLAKSGLWCIRSLTRGSQGLVDARADHGASNANPTYQNTDRRAVRVAHQNLDALHFAYRCRFRTRKRSTHGSAFGRQSQLRAF